MLQVDGARPCRILFPLSRVRLALDQSKNNNNTRSPVAIGDDEFGQCSHFDRTAKYTYVDAGQWHTVLLSDDGSAKVFGQNIFGQCDLPKLPDGVCFMPPAVQKPVFVVQLFWKKPETLEKFDHGHIVGRNLSGGELFTWSLSDRLNSDNRLLEFVKYTIATALNLRSRRFAVVLPNGQIADSTLTWSDAKENGSLWRHEVGAASGAFRAASG